MSTAGTVIFSYLCKGNLTCGSVNAQWLVDQRQSAKCRLVLTGSESKPHESTKSRHVRGHSWIKLYMAQWKNNPPTRAAHVQCMSPALRRGVHIVFKHHWVSVWKVKAASRAWHVASVSRAENTSVGPDTRSWRPAEGRKPEDPSRDLQRQDQLLPPLGCDLWPSTVCLTLEPKTVI